MALIDVVRNSAGVELAAFLSSIDARKWAARHGADCLVTDWGGTVTRHAPGEPMQITTRGADESYQHVRKQFPDAVDLTDEQVQS